MFPLMLTAIALIAPAHAQDRTPSFEATADGASATDDPSTADPTVGELTVTGDRGRDVDWAYLDYLDALDEAGELEITQDQDQCQLWDGSLSVELMSSPTRIGTVFVGGGDWEFQQTKEETWYFSALPAWGQGFRVVHDGPYDEGDESSILGTVDPGWAQNPCFNMMAKYTVQPDPGLTAQWDYEPNIDRYHFELLQWDALEGAYVKQGDLLREFHHVPNMAERYIDHWTFYGSYEKPMDLGDELLVVPAVDQYDTTSAFWMAMQDDNQEHVQLYGEPLFDRYAQIQYKQRKGFVCDMQQGF